jgi:hypothetical protein
MATPNIVLGIALPSRLSRGIWEALSVLAFAYAVVAWLYPAMKRPGQYALLLLALVDIVLTAIEMRSDVTYPIGGPQAVSTASLTLDIFQLIPALVVSSHRKLGAIYKLSAPVNT